MMALAPTLVTMAEGESPSPTTSLLPTTVIPSTVRINQTENIDGPDHKFQLSDAILYENEFHGHTYVSAHLQRLQHGIYYTERMHGKDPVHVTFVAVTFTFHPSLSLSHRFQSAVINISALSEYNEPLRFVKFAPHIAFGRMSSETLKWNFQLGATVGLSKGPVNVCVNPTGGYSKEKVQGTMLKIQGSTRTHEHHHIHRQKVQDGKLVWSLEENDQQQAGLPREFTFVFLIARNCKTPKQKQFLKKHNKEDEKESQHIAHAKVSDEKIVHQQADERAAIDHATTFGPMSLEINIKPSISGIMGKIEHANEETQKTILHAEVGQTMGATHTHRAASWNSTAEDSGGMLEGYYNFALMKGSFEDLVELPGNAVTSVEPTLSGQK